MWAAKSKKKKKKDVTALFFVVGVSLGNAAAAARLHEHQSLASFACAQVCTGVCVWPHLVSIDPVAVFGCQVGFHSLQ